MPGIVGLLTRRPRAQAEAELVCMLESLRHENFYVTGMWQDETLGVYVGWIARKNSFAAGMPVINESKDVILTFSGEEFPEPGTPHRLRGRGHAVDTDGPSYLVHLYEDDPAFPAGLNGRFHGLVVDRRHGTATLFNDRFGMHPLYYHDAGDAFYFGAEAKAILAVRPELRRLDPRSVGEFVACGSVLEGRSVFSDIRVLPGAAAWVFRQGVLERRRTYFDPRAWEQQEPLEPEAYAGQLRTVFARNLPRYFEAGDPVAVSLTGGLDTRMIMAWQKAAPGSLPCYTFGGMRRECRDVTIARRVAALCRQPYEVITVGPEFLTRFDEYAERTVYLTEGRVDVGRAPDLYLNERARDVAPVRMTGNYGGELLRGVRAFKPVPPATGVFAREIVMSAREAVDTYAGAVGGHPVSFALFKQGPWHHTGVLALEETQVALRSPYLDNDLVRTVFRAPASTFATSDVCLRLIAEGDPALRRLPTDRGLGGAPGSPSAALSRSALEFLFKAEYGCDLGMPQWAAHVVPGFVSRGLERLFLGRHKIGHFRVWYRDLLGDYLRDVLLDARTASRPYIERTGLHAMVDGHLGGARNYTSEIHKVLTLELLHRLFIDAR